jgi:hypothetical protein
VLTSANVAGTNGLTCLPKHGEARHNKFLVTHLMTDQCCLTSGIARRSTLTAEPSSSSSPIYYFYVICDSIGRRGVRTVNDIRLQMLSWTGNVLMALLAGSERSSFFIVDYPSRRFSRSTKFLTSQTRTWLSVLTVVNCRPSTSLQRLIRARSRQSSR